MAKAGGAGGGGGGAFLTSAAGVTTDAYAPLFTLLGLDGLIGIGTIKNNSPTPATGRIFANFPGTLIPNGQTFTLDDGANPPTVFEFSDVGVTPGNVKVDTAGAGSGGILLLRITNAINGVAGSLLITATLNPGDGSVDLENGTPGTVGNQAITDTVTEAQFTTTGMSDGTDADDLIIKETVIDAFGVIGFVETTVLAGDSYMLDLQTNFDQACPPHVSYSVEVKDAVVGLHAAFEVQLTAVEGGGSSGTLSFPPTTYSFTSPGVLTTIPADNALISWLPGAGRIISQLVGLVKTAPTGDDIILEFFVGDMATGALGASLGTVTILDGTFTKTVPITPVVIGFSQFVALVINQVGSGVAGSNLTAIAR